LFRSYLVTAINPEGTGVASAPAAVTPPPKQLCVNSNSQRAMFAFDATQSGAATPVRTLGGPSSSFGLATAVAASLPTDELFVIKQGGRVDVYPLGANGAGVTPLRTLLGATPGGVFFALDTANVVGQIH